MNAAGRRKSWCGLVRCNGTDYSTKREERRVGTTFRITRSGLLCVLKFTCIIIVLCSVRTALNWSREARARETGGSCGDSRNGNEKRNIYFAAMQTAVLQGKIDARVRRTCRNSLQRMENAASVRRRGRRTRRFAGGSTWRKVNRHVKIDSVRYVIWKSAGQ